MYSLILRRKIGVLVFMFIGSCAAASHAAISISGNVVPTYNGTDPWNASTWLIVGDQADGSLTIDNGSVYDQTSAGFDFRGYLGSNQGVTGTVTVTGANSTFNIDQDLYIGEEGTGSLIIANGGVANIPGITWLGQRQTGIGKIQLDNGVVSTGLLAASPSELLGNGTINTEAFIGDIDLVYDANNGLQQQVILNSLPGQNVTVNINSTSLTEVEALGAGFRSSGTLRLADLQVADTRYGYFGYHSGSNGAGTISDSSWDVLAMYIGYYGTGQLNIENGSVMHGNAYLGREPGASGTLTVSGSTWSDATDMSIGQAGTGLLTVTNAGSVAVNNIVAGEFSGSQGTITVSGPGATLDNGNTKIGLAGLGELQVLAGGQMNSGAATLGFGGTGVATISGAGSSWNLRFLLTVGDEGSGTLTVDNGGIVTSKGVTLGADPDNGGVGSVLVTDPGTILDSSAPLRVSGASSFQVLNGAVVNNTMGVLAEATGTPGTAVVSGAGSRWNNYDLIVAETRPWLIENGAVVDVANHALIHSSLVDGSPLLISNGTLNTGSLTASLANLAGVGTFSVQGLVSDIDLIFDAQHDLQQQVMLNSLPGQNILINIDMASPNATRRLGAGFGGAGTLRIADGKAITSTYGMIAQSLGSTGTATVTGPGSTWNTGWGNLEVGSFGEGTLKILDGATVTAERSNLGSYSPDAMGAVHVSGQDSLFQLSDRLIVGLEGQGELRIENGGSVIANGLIIGDQSNSISSVVVSGPGSVLETAFISAGFAAITIDNAAVVEVDSTLAISNSSTLHLSGGTLKIRSKFSGGSTPGVLNFTGGRFEGPTLFLFSQPFIQSGGTFAPGHPIGHTDISNSYNLTAGTLEIELGGPGNPHDLLTATGDIDIALTGTTLDLPALGAMATGTYTVIESTGGTITGTFEHITGLGIHPGLVDVNYTTNAVTVTLNWDYLPGDLNADGFVGIDDLNTILIAWNQSVTPGDLASGDITGDGFIGIDDLTTVLSNWNTSVPPPGHISNAIPEPTSLGLVSLGVLSVCGCRRLRLSAA